MRDASKARGVEHTGVFERRATPLAPMQRWPNALVISRLALRLDEASGRPTAGRYAPKNRPVCQVLPSGDKRRLCMGAANFPSRPRPPMTPRDRLFAEIALKQGLLDRPTVARLLNEASTSNKDLRGLLVSQNLLTSSQAEEIDATCDRLLSRRGQEASRPLVGPSARNTETTE